MTGALGRHGTTLVVTVAAAGLSLAAQLLVAARLGVGDYGYFAAVYAVAQLVAPLATFGLTPILPRLIVDMTARNAAADVRGVVSYGCGLASTTATVVAVIALAILGPAPGGGGAWVWSVLVVVTMAVRRVLTMALVGLGRSRTAVFTGEGLPAAVLALGALVAGPTTASDGLVIAGLAGLFGTGSMLVLTGWSVGAGAVGFRCREWLRESWPAFGARAADSVLTRIDLLVVGPTLGLAALGTFTAAMRIAQGLQVLVTSTSAASAHVFARASDEADHHRVRGEYRIAMFFSAVIGVPVVIGVIVCRDQIVSLLIPDGFVGAAGVLAWCALAQLANVVSGPSATLMYLAGRAESLLRIGVISVDWAVRRHGSSVSRTAWSAPPPAMRSVSGSGRHSRSRGSRGRRPASTSAARP